MRGFALAIYSSGVYIGAGIGIFLGGWIVEGWRALYPKGGAPFDLAGWQVAFFAVGLPGLLLVALGVEPRASRAAARARACPSRRRTPIRSGSSGASCSQWCRPSRCSRWRAPAAGRARSA